MSLFNKANRIAIASILIFVVTACGSNEFTVTSTFSNAKDIPEGTLVYFDNQAIGEVIDVETSEQGVTAYMALDKEVVDKISANAAVVVNRMKEQSPLEIYNRTPPEDDLLKAGQEIKGFDSMFQLGAWMVGDSIKFGSNSVSDYLESFQGYLQSEKFDEDKKVVRDQFNIAKGLAQDAIQQVEQDLNDATQQLAHSEEIAAEVVEELSEELAPIIKELANGGADLVNQLEQFAAGLDQTDPERREAGKKLLESFMKSIEQLNQSMEEGVEKNLESEN